MTTYRVCIYGSGAEVTIGTVNNQQKRLLCNANERLNEAVLNDLKEQGDWYSIDDQFHEWGAGKKFTIRINDTRGETLYEIDADNMGEYDTDEFNLRLCRPACIDNSKDLLMCVSHEKGVFFEGEISITDDFDLKKLRALIRSRVGITNYAYGEMITGLTYDDELICNNGGDTVGKSFEAFKNF